MILHGPPGVGKTHLAVSIMQVVGGACLVSWPFILDELRDNAGRPEEPYPQHISDLLYRTGLLVVDDFDKDIDSTWAQRQLYQLVSRRYVLRLPTVWTANTQLDQSVGPVALACETGKSRWCCRSLVRTTAFKGEDDVRG